LETAKKLGPTIQRVVVTELPTRFGTFSIYGYRETQSGVEHVALVKGTLPVENPTLVRIHSECLTGEAFGSLRCDCRAQLDLALEAIAAAGSGVVVYLRGHEVAASDSSTSCAPMRCRTPAATRRAPTANYGCRSMPGITRRRFPSSTILACASCADDEQPRQN